MLLEINPSTTPRITTLDPALMQRGMMQLPAVLQRMNFSGLRPGQDKVVLNLLGGRDTLCILPTGMGKTACFTVPALCHGWRALVFSPLLALMRDQVQSAQRKGIAAAMIGGSNPGMNMLSIERWTRGELQLLYVAPERLGNEQFHVAMRACPPDLVVVDEAHCISQWSDTFRSEYAHIGDFIAHYRPKVVASMTATCPPLVEDDIRRVLRSQNAQRLLYYPRRTNLILRSKSLPSPPNNHKVTMETYTDDLRAFTKDVRETEGSTIVYTTTIACLTRVAKFFTGNLGEPFTVYYGDGMPQDQKDRNQDQFMGGHVRVIICTCAFGMGVDKPDIRNVMHFDQPSSVEALAQETGRAGRDGEIAYCTTYFSSRAHNTNMWFFRNSHPTEEHIRAQFSLYLRRRQPDGNVYLRDSDTDELLGWNNMMRVSAVRQILRNHKILIDAKDAVKPCSVSFRNIIDLPKFREYKSAIERISEVKQRDDKEPVYSFNLELMANTLSVDAKTVRKNLNGFHKSGFLDFTPPFNGKPFQIQGSIDQVDFDRLKAKTVEDLKKLNEVRFYDDIPDERKHDFLEEYFGVHRANTQA